RHRRPPRGDRQGERSHAPRQHGAPSPAPAIATLETVRSFIAVLLGEDVRARLAEEIARLRGLSRNVAWTVPENLHITLKFLGPIELTQRALVATALARLAGGVPAFDITLRGLGAFPSLTRPRVIWGGVDDGAHALTSLAD